MFRRYLKLLKTKSIKSQNNLEDEDYKKGTVFMSRPPSLGKLKVLSCIAIVASQMMTLRKGNQMIWKMPHKDHLLQPLLVWRAIILHDFTEAT